MTQTMQTFASFFIRDFKLAISYKLDFFLRIFNVIVQLLFLYCIAELIGENQHLDNYGGYLPFSIIGISVLSYFYTGFTSFTDSLRREQMMGTLEALLMTPATLYKIILGSSIWNFAWASFIAVLYWFMAILFFDFVIVGNIILALALLFLTTLFFASLGIISASFIMVFKRGSPIGVLAGTLSSMLGGAFFPIEVLPAWLQKISYLLPITYSLTGLRDILLLDHSFTMVMPDFIILLGFNLVFIPISLWCFKLSVRYAQREGSLLHY